MQPSTLASFWTAPEPQAFRRVYHVSPLVLTPAIQQHGIDPVFANGMTKVSYYVEKKALLWAIAHVSAMKHISVDQLCIHRADIWKGVLIHTIGEAIYTCKYAVFPSQHYTWNAVFTWFEPDGKFRNG